MRRSNISRSPSSGAFSRAPGAPSAAHPDSTSGTTRLPPRSQRDPPVRAPPPVPPGAAGGGLIHRRRWPRVAWWERGGPVTCWINVSASIVYLDAPDHVTDVCNTYMCCPPYIAGPDPGISARLMHVVCMTHMHLTTCIHALTNICQFSAACGGAASFMIDCCKRRGPLSTDQLGDELREAHHAGLASCRLEPHHQGAGHGAPGLGLLRPPLHLHLHDV